ncbi:MAG: polyribonucleotide nucleotidyltransferase [Flavobacteriales bacterium TMED191]|nr:MAG: polyribonucleotide nucleotidyltransferase [Flavobacteriales bacterium TMED191]|tara:strand:+ start:44 stop:2155 length:2112 start_codon:yes stop_codon:yes gene_type:complete
MKPELKKVTISLDNDRDITIETGLLAKQAHGSCVVRMGDTMILATVVSDKKEKDVDFLPLSVDYREKFAADGRFPGGFLKREARPSDQEILGMRLVDRVLRPLFPKNYHFETQIMIQLMSHDKNVDPYALLGLAASTALTLSDIPFEGPISETRVGRINGNFIANPSPEQLEESDIDLMIGASVDSVVMVEGEMKEISENEMIEAIKFGHEAIKIQCNSQLELSNLLGTNEKRAVETVESTPIAKKVSDLCYEEIYGIASKKTTKKERSNLIEQLKEKLMSNFSEEELEEHSSDISKEFYTTQKDAIRNFILDTHNRLDGRKTDEIRPIWCEVDYLPKTHGSAVFTRGETQSLTTVTLGTSLDENRLDTVTRQGAEKFYLHYNFPPFSTGEARMKFNVSRREIGHGNLAQRALKDMINDSNPYTIRVVSEILESNGSSSMATVCAGTLALMDAGVNITRPVSGIAMGLITNEDNSKYAILSDILGDEDFLGDMDFKVTGTTEGITACQMDMKVKGLPYNILEEALNQSKAGRLHILEEMLKTLSTSRETPKEHSPKMVTMTIPKDMIGGVIGPGGKVIQKMQETTETTITINEEDNVGIVEILGVNSEGIKNAQEKIKEICFIPEVGTVYKGIVKSIQPYGAFVEIKKGTDGLLHISEIAWKRLEKVEEVLKEGDAIDVKLVSIDPKNGKMKLSRKVLLEKPE